MAVAGDVSLFGECGHALLVWDGLRCFKAADRSLVMFNRVRYCCRSFNSLCGKLLRSSS